MDINEALLTIRASIRHAQNMMLADTHEPQFCVVDNRTVLSIDEAWCAIDQWLSRGGFLPTDWQR